MDVRSQKTYEALFALEDLREILRETSPTHELNNEQSKRFHDILQRVKKTLEEIEYNKSGSEIKYLADRIELRLREEDHINLNPIQAGGRLTPEARKALIAYGDGYSVCDHCLKPFRLDYIKRPPVQEFYSELADFLNMDAVRVVKGARSGFQIVANALLDKGDTALIAEVGHYSLALAIESAGAEWKEISLDENNIITAENTQKKIEEVKRDTGKLPKLIAIPHIDYTYGNEHKVKEIADVAHEYDIPFLYNGAYTVGVMPVDGKEIGADFIIGSGHKSMASPAPTGVLATTREYAEKIFKTTSNRGDISGRSFGIKEVYLLGCTVMGAPLIAMMASFPRVKERVKHWDQELKKIEYFIKEFLNIEGNSIISELPRRHTFTKVDCTNSFDKVAQTHKKKGFFLYDELDKRKITGIFPGATKQLKLSTYGLTWEQIKYLTEAFKDIAEKHGITVK
ncbi:MAG: O-phospho-L-seryl-tRNA:Cys-tRNA synthase [Candidatus Altiarchaeota archaeon]|nr:O-phospho-L-seryl-tRNA:Cys-tRNA synthase [Candidatus Altiarchaeota archaeon]